MRPSPAISIITPTRNRAEALRRAVRSVQDQSCLEYEHLIIDDASEDETHEQMRMVADPRLRYVRFDQWRGANAARNVGIEQARGRWVTFLDSDDEFLPHRLEATLARCQSEPGCELWLSSFTGCKREKRAAIVNPDAWLGGTQLERALMTYSIAIAGSAITASRRLLRRAGGFDERVLRMQDRELLLRLAQRSGARTTAEIDWVKHASADSISGQRGGYVESLAALLRLRPDLSSKHRQAVGYQVARRLLSDLLQGRLGTLSTGWRANRRSPELGFSWRELIEDYRAGKRLRRSAIAWLNRDDRPRVASSIVEPQETVHLFQQPLTAHAA